LQKLDAATGKAMSINEYVVRERAGLWELWLGGRLVTGQPTRGYALGVARALAAVDARRGQPSSIRASTMDGMAIEIPIDPIPANAA